MDDDLRTVRDDLQRARWLEAREMIAGWLVVHGFPQPAPGERFPTTVLPDGGRVDGDDEMRAALLHGVPSPEHFAASALQLIDRILEHADSDPWLAVALAHELGVLDGDARLTGIEPIWRIGHNSREGAIKGGKTKSKASRDKKMATEFRRQRAATPKRVSDSKIMDRVGKELCVNPSAARKAIRRGLKLLD